MAFPTKTIENFVKAGYPVIYLVSWEEERVENTVRSIGKNLYGESGNFSVWSCAEGSMDSPSVNGTKNLMDALSSVIDDHRERVFTSSRT